jgi:hypothetical protein
MWRWGGGAPAVSGGDDVFVLGQREQMVSAAADFEAVFVTEAGVEQRVPWDGRLITDLAERIGVSLVELEGWLGGDDQPTHGELSRLSDASGVISV